jgi:hypothetical protein
MPFWAMRTAISGDGATHQGLGSGSVAKTSKKTAPEGNGV